MLDAQSKRAEFAHRVGRQLLPHVSLSLSIGAGGTVGTRLTVATCSYSTLASALKSTALEMLPKRERRQPGWFEANADQLHALICDRNTALSALQRHRTPATVARRGYTREALRTALRAAKSSWLIQKCSTINDGIVASHGTFAAWNVVSEIRSGLLGTVRRPAPPAMQKADGSKASTPEENASVFAEHFGKLYGRSPQVDTSVLDLLSQRPTAVGLDGPPSDIEIRCALGKLRNSAPGDSGLTAPLWKALGDDETTFTALRQLILSIWDSEEMPTEWETGLLAILPKKGDRSLPGNYRGIMMLEVGYKILANLMLMRLQPVLESPAHVDHESQCGFRTGRGCSDASFTVKQIISKRREHSLETWVFFLDLVKAFDRVARCCHHTIPRHETDAARAAQDVKLGMLWRVLLRYGVPPKLVRLLIAMHKLVLVKFDIGGIVQILEAILGVKQGDLLGPPLFDFYIAAVMETWRLKHSYPLPTFRTREDLVMTGRRPTAAGETFQVGDSEYADDTGLPFCSRSDAEEWLPHVYTHFARFDMEVHSGELDSTGKEIKSSKSEMLFCAAPRHTYLDPDSYDGADLSHILLPGNRFVPVVDEFPYLGDVITRDGTATRAVEARVQAGSRAFGALRSCVFVSTHVSKAAKQAVYETVVNSITYYGSECWSLTEDMLNRLRGVQAWHVRAMSRVTRRDTWERHISTLELQQGLGLKTVDHYIVRRQLRWLGHVRRMDFSRMPRRMLSAWVPHKRPVGAPVMTYGRSVLKALKKFNIDPATWGALAADRMVWRETLQLGYPAIRRSSRVARLPQQTDFRKLAGLGK